MEEAPEPKTNITFVLVEPEKEGNIGSIARAMKNFGFKHLCLVAPCTIGDEAKNYSVHAIDVLEAAEIITFPSDGQPTEVMKQSVIRDLFSRFDTVIGTSCRFFKERTIHRIPISIEEFIEDLRGVEGKEYNRLAIVLGNERTGLTNYILDEIDYLVTIPTTSEYSSLNLSHAATIFMYELSKVYKSTGVQGEIKQASRDKREVLHAYFEDMIELTKTPLHRAKRTSRAFKSMLSRSHVSRRELSLLLGVFRECVDIAKGNIGSRYEQG